MIKFHINASLESGDSYLRSMSVILRGLIHGFLRGTCGVPYMLGTSNIPRWAAVEAVMGTVEALLVIAEEEEEEEQEEEVEEDVVEMVVTPVVVALLLPPAVTSQYSRTRFIRSHREGVR
jgi:hypothetical protein